ncbi:hypothetical protein VTL71DRAFT_15215 [Oculimacula yallundae]|uniref:Uncharacterized protein n=1 Tax=Oculimacula yallundae TaxID=86028 RepID=A0ABR4CGP3_9HELO
MIEPIQQCTSQITRSKPSQAQYPKVSNQRHNTRSAHHTSKHNLCSYRPTPRARRLINQKTKKIERDLSHPYRKSFYATYDESLFHKTH